MSELELSLGCGLARAGAEIPSVHEQDSLRSSGAAVPFGSHQWRSVEFHTVLRRLIAGELESLSASGYDVGGHPAENLGRLDDESPYYSQLETFRDVERERTRDQLVHLFDAPPPPHSISPVEQAMMTEVRTVLHELLSPPQDHTQHLAVSDPFLVPSLQPPDHDRRCRQHMSGDVLPLFPPLSAMPALSDRGCTPALETSCVPRDDQCVESSTVGHFGPSFRDSAEDLEEDEDVERLLLREALREEEDNLMGVADMIDVGLDDDDDGSSIEHGGPWNLLEIDDLVHLDSADASDGTSPTSWYWSENEHENDSESEEVILMVGSAKRFWDALECKDEPDVESELILLGSPAPRHADSYSESGSQPLWQVFPRGVRDDPGEIVSASLRSEKSVDHGVFCSAEACTFSADTNTGDDEASLRSSLPTTKVGTFTALRTSIFGFFAACVHDSCTDVRPQAPHFR